MTENELYFEYCQNESQESFAKLYLQVKPWLNRMLFSIVPDNEAVKDIQQELWIILVNNCKKYKPNKGNINNYIFTIAKHLAFKYRKTSKLIDKRRNHNEQYSDRREVETNNSVIEQVLKNERSLLIKCLISKLNKNYQSVLLLYYFADFDINKIAEILEKPEGTIKTWLRRARIELAKKLIKNKIMDK